MEYYSTIKRNEQLINPTKGDFQMHYAKWKKPDSKYYIWLIPFLWHSCKVKIIEIETNQWLQMLRSGGGGLTTDGQRGCFGVMELFCIFICQNMYNYTVKGVTLVYVNYTLIKTSHLCPYHMTEIKTWSLLCALKVKRRETERQREKVFQSFILWP